MTKNQEIDIIKWCLLQEVGRCDDMEIAELFDGKTFSLDYRLRREADAKALAELD